MVGGIIQSYKITPLESKNYLDLSQSPSGTLCRGSDFSTPIIFGVCNTEHPAALFSSVMQGCDFHFDFSQEIV